MHWSYGYKTTKLKYKKATRSKFIILMVEIKFEL